MLVGYTKDEFDSFIRENGHRVLIAVPTKKLHCDCWDPRTDEGNPECRQCIGLGWMIDWYWTLTRRSKTGMRSDRMTRGEEPLELYTTHYYYYFMTEVDLRVDAYILEFDKGRPYTAHQITNYSPEKGEYGTPSFYTSLAYMDVVTSDSHLKQVYAFAKRQGIDEVM